MINIYRWLFTEWLHLQWPREDRQVWSQLFMYSRSQKQSISKEYNDAEHEYINICLSSRISTFRGPCCFYYHHQSFNYTEIHSLYLLYVRFETNSNWTQTKSSIFRQSPVRFHPRNEGLSRASCWRSLVLWRHRTFAHRLALILFYVVILSTSAVILAFRYLWRFPLEPVRYDEFLSNPHFGLCQLRMNFCYC